MPLPESTTGWPHKMATPAAAAVTATDALTTPFKVARLRTGYDPVQVDDFTDKVAQSLEVAAAGGKPQLTLDDLVDAQFTPTRFQGGYNMDQVDDFLDEVADTLLAAATSSPARGSRTWQVSFIETVETTVDAAFNLADYAQWLAVTGLVDGPNAAQRYLESHDPAALLAALRAGATSSPPRTLEGLAITGVRTAGATS